MRAVFLDRETLGEGVDLSATESRLTELVSHERTEPGELLDRIRGFEVIVVNKVVIGRDDLDALEQPPRLICVVATGVNNVDLEACRDLGITVVNVRGYGTDAVAQHTLCLMLALNTRLLDYHAAVESGDWHRSQQFCLLQFPIRELAGQTLGIVGLGTLGSRVAELARAFGMQVLVAQRPGSEAGQGSRGEADRVPLDELLPRVDVLSLHCPLTDNTRDLINAERIARMQRHAMIINTARGGLVNEEALVAALREGRLGGAGFDVLTSEPPRAGNPLLDEDIPNLIVTPHTAWASREARQRVCDQLAENIGAWMRGETIRAVA